MTIKQTRKYFTNEGLRVKRTSISRRYGVRCSNPHEAANNRVWPGEIGTLTRRTIEGNGWKQRVLEAEFTHGRTVRVAASPLFVPGSPPDDSLIDWSFEVGFDPEEFILVKKLPTV